MTTITCKCGREFSLESNLHRNADQKWVVYVTCPACDDVLWTDSDGLDDDDANAAAAECLADQVV